LSSLPENIGVTIASRTISSENS